MANPHWKLNPLQYYEAPGLCAYVFHSRYPEGKQGGIEITQHGERIATNGDLRLEPTPGQWAQIPVVEERQVDEEHSEVSVHLSYEALNLDCALRVQPDGQSLL